MSDLDDLREPEIVYDISDVSASDEDVESMIGPIQLLSFAWTHPNFIFR